ncbi:MAG: helix-turn-helix domain-containing protein [Candidatus Thiodiazotropha lotti]|nr:helix-turn-helix domain-containing protein [Candidatus Thiodiazotropha endoloripes]MCG7898955.1 helix-turn-helix domain-containing protein [Candidatus Thiodiazotropha weberae]MCG7993183.1 helix-turn-helix domain-containing protein [Candidatus Thiodiazotropha lotti]MCG7915479.1 helix-turn-helix domain-containing protein [Candidatus Thiodiazotropha weberae]MCG8000789.1 helix-turn-helix domain-containing protein [Candidatus Thiodiazotropha lotti]MCW4184845.1 helix-turn-helix domain-containing 
MKTFISTEGREAATRLAAKCGTKYIYLTQIASGFRKPSGRLTLLLERHSEGKLSRYELRPDLYPKAQSEQQISKCSS